MDFILGVEFSFPVEIVSKSINFHLEVKELHNFNIYTQKIYVYGS